MEPFFEKGFWVATVLIMRNAIGFLIILWGLSHFFSSAFLALDDAARESLRTVETAAKLSQQELLKKE